MRFSLRELLTVATIASLAVPALYFANAVAYGVVVTLTAMTVVGALIHALLGSGAERAAAIGFLAPSLGFALVLTLGGIERLDKYLEHLPTHAVLRPTCTWLQQRRSYWQYADGTRLSRTEIEQIQNEGRNVDWGQLQYAQLPPRRPFHMTAHCFWTLLLGYAGMKYAQRIHARRAAGATIAADGIDQK